MKVKARGRGFTLIELLIVLAIVALLLTIAMPNYLVAMDRSRDAVLRENLRVIRASLDRFLEDRGHYPESLDELVEQHYLRALPEDPQTRSAHTWIARPASGGDVAGVAEVRSGAPGGNREGRSYESF